MTDRELIERAAKAAGIAGAYHAGYETFWIAEHLRGDEREAYEARRTLGLQHNRISWNPLSDDGDALRLAVNLELEIRYAGGCAVVRRHNLGGCSECAVVGRDGDSILSATRRAIVRAAAAMAAK